MNDTPKPTTKLKLVFLQQTRLSLLYRKNGGKTQWVPRSACAKIFMHGNREGDTHEVNIEDWWLMQNPFDSPKDMATPAML